MASIRVGFLFNDKSFFNCEVDASEIGALYGVNGNWRASVLAGRMASQKSIELSSSDLSSFEVGGNHPGEVEDDILYQVQELGEVNGNWRASVLAGRMASQKSIELSSSDLSSFEVGGNHPGEVEDDILYQVQELGEEMRNEKTETCASAETDERHHWTHEGIFLLLELYMLNIANFLSPIMTERQAWKKVAESMAGKGYKLTWEICEKKFNNMKLRYKAIVDNNNATGRGTRKWKYFDNMQQLLCKDPSVEPPVTVSSLSGTRVNGPKRKLFEENRHPSTADTDITPPPCHNEDSSTKKKSKKLDKENSAPSWFQEWATSNHSIMTELVYQTKRKNDLLEKLLKKL